MNKLYVIVRKDLSTSQRAVQAGHVVAEFMLRKPTKWNNEILVYLGVKNLFELELIKYKLELNNIETIEFKEPDLNNEITAIACNSKHKILKQLKLL